MEIACLAFLAGLIIGGLAGCVVGESRGFRTGEKLHKAYLDGCAHCKDIHHL